MAKKKRSKANTDPPTPRSRGFKSLDPKTAFELEEKIGKGSYGEVYRAKDVKSGGIFAMKTILLEHEDSALDIKDQIDSFQKCSHKNIVDYLACYIVEQSLWVWNFILLFSDFDGILLGGFCWQHFTSFGIRNRRRFYSVHM